MSGYHLFLIVFAVALAASVLGFLRVMYILNARDRGEIL